jgi:hypothetical protein
LQIYKVDVDVDPKYLKIWNQLRNDGGTNVVDVDLEVLESVENVDVRNFQLILKTIHWSSQFFQFRITLFKNCSDHFESYFRSGVISGCHENDINDKVLMFIFKELAKYGNVTKACPLKKVSITAEIIIIIIKNKMLIFI